MVVPSPLLTIVTVLKDDPSGLVRTMSSLGRPPSSDVEWLVVDSSADVDPVSSILSSSKWEVDLLWTKPAGVYSAMNEGLSQARGHYVWFVNAGDRVNSGASISAVLQILEKRPVWAYGQVRFIDNRGRTVLPKPFDYEREKRSGFSRGRFPPHQGTVAATQVMRDLGGFDESFEVAADYAMMLRLSLLDDPVESRNVWADFYEGGLSTIQWRDAIQEFHRARLEILQPSGLDLVKERAAVTREFAVQAIGRSLNSIRK